MTQGNTVNWKVTSGGKKAFKPYCMKFSPSNEENPVLRRNLVALKHGSRSFQMCFTFIIGYWREKWIYHPFIDILFQGKLS